MQKVIINPGFGGNESGNISGNIIEKDYNLEISMKIFEELRALGVNAYLVRNDDRTLSDAERLEIINSYTDENDEVIVLTNILASGNDSGAEIIYALKDPDTLASEISLNIENAGQNILKYYQLRDPENTAFDFYDIIKNIGNAESIIVSYGYPSNSNDNLFLEGNQDNLAKAVATAIYDYLSRNNIYTVQSGDSLYIIANKFGTTVDAIKELNGLANNSLDVGQELIIPKEKEIIPNINNDFMYYTVQSGDSLYSIARAFNTTINTIKEINNLTSNVLTLGSTLKIPKEVTTEDEGNYIIYTVKSGDSLYLIAEKYGTTVDEIKNLNGLSSNNLSIGEILKIPKSNTGTNNLNYFNYTVKSGDSLYKIANLYNTDVSNLKKLNNLTSNNLSIGQILKIPK